MAKTLQEARKDFPMLKKSMHGKRLIYFDSAATTQKPHQVIDAMTDFYENGYGTVHRAVYELAVHSTEDYQNTRKKVQKFLHAASENEIIYTRGTTASTNALAYSFGKAFVKPGDEILVSEIEHHSNIVPWQMLCEDRQATLRVAPVNNHGEILLDELQKLLSEKTKLFAVGHVSNALGTINPIKEMTKMAHAVGARVFVDGAQAAPHIRIDVQDLDVDFYAFSGHKMYGPTGIGILYGRESLLESMPPYQGGGDMVDIVTFEKTTYNALPMKFEAGTPMIAEVIGLGKAIDYINDIGIEAIQTWEHELLQHATEQLLKVGGLRIIGTAKEKGAIIGFVVEGVHPLDIGTMLDLRGIALRTGHHCAQPTMRRFGIEGSARVSFGLYNTKEEIDQFIDALNDVLILLRG